MASKRKNVQAATTAAPLIETTVEAAPPAEQSEPEVFAHGAYRVFTLTTGQGKLVYGTKDITDQVLAQGATGTAKELKALAQQFGTLALSRSTLVPRSQAKVRQAIAALHGDLPPQ